MKNEIHHKVNTTREMIMYVTDTFTFVDFIKHDIKPIIYYRIYERH